jgi:hypothetical protein
MPICTDAERRLSASCSLMIKERAPIAVAACCSDAGGAHVYNSVTVDELGGPRDYVMKLTSGFHPASGVRGGKPKDLWFGIYRNENEERFLGNDN